MLREGIRLLQERETRLLVLDHALAQGIADSEVGRVKPMADIVTRLEAKYSAVGHSQG